MKEIVHGRIEQTVDQVRDWFEEQNFIPLRTAADPQRAIADMSSKVHRVLHFPGASMFVRRDYLRAGARDLRESSRDPLRILGGFTDGGFTRHRAFAPRSR